jgi:hypothetical protein
VVFSDNETATAALVGIYLDIYRNASFAGGGQLGLSTLAGLSSDELKNNPHNDPLSLDFEHNSLNASNSYVLGLWTSMYKAIYQANAIIEGLRNSSAISSSAKQQLTGEALFIRAFCHFYLVNIFGDVPLVITTNYATNNGLKRSNSSIVYDQIKSDLVSAEELMSNEYITTGRVRPNRFTATALLSRVYLYTNDWPRAEDKATNIISNSDLYYLPNNLKDVFLQGSTEAIWQIKPADKATFTNEGYYFSVVFGPQFNVLNSSIPLEYEPNDQRKENWLISTMSGNKTVYLPYKYKKFDLSTPTNEYSMVIRLAELYLIRSEARLKQDKLSGAISDLDVVRARAHLPLIQDTNPHITKDSLFLQIVHERQIELMTEWGHRWFDLKRWGLAIDVLDSMKSDLVVGDLVYPIPQQELNNNTNLNPQNAGY